MGVLGPGCATARSEGNDGAQPHTQPQPCSSAEESARPCTAASTPGCQVALQTSSSGKSCRTQGTWRSSTNESPPIISDASALPVVITVCVAGGAGSATSPWRGERVSWWGKIASPDKLLWRPGAGWTALDGTTIQTSCPSMARRGWWYFCPLVLRAADSYRLPGATMALLEGAEC